MSSFRLLTPSNTKTRKGENFGYQTFILHLSPASLSGFGNVCPKASKGCMKACLNKAGHGGMFKPGLDTNVVQEARKNRTRWFFQNRTEFLNVLVDDINRAIKNSQKKNLIPVFRLNGTSDISWEKYKIETTGKNIFEMFPDFQFYDYTKVPNRKVKHLKNYHLTFSKSEDNDQDVAWAIQHGLNVAVVFDQLPDTYLGLKVINGDQHDLRFLDQKNVIVGLKAKGPAKKDTTSFVIRLVQV